MSLRHSGQQESIVINKSKFQNKAKDLPHKSSFKLKAVSFGYDQALINRLTFTLNRGDHVGIVGRNGCGKSTLIKLMLGELTPTEGEVIHGPTLNVAYFDQKKDHWI